MKFQLEQLCKFVGQVTDPKTAANVDLNDIRLVKKSLGEIDIRWKSPGVQKSGIHPPIHGSFNAVEML